MEMKYSELADVYEHLEGTPSKLKKAEMIAAVLKKAPANLLPVLVLMLSGRVLPDWSEAEIGVADKTVMKAISKATGATEGEVSKLFSKIGDLGSVVEELVKKKTQRTLKGKTLDVETVHGNLAKLAETGGAGSQERKISLLTELIMHASPKEARYIIRTALGQLRVGVAEGIVRDAIASAYKIDADIVEGAWFLRPHYGEIAEIAKEKGDAGLRKVKLELGMPLMVQLAEKSPSLEDALRSFKRPALQYKYDGMRTLVEKKGEKVWLFTRRLENVTAAFPDIVAAVKKAVKAKDCILDGEALAIHPKTGKPQPFQRLSQRIKRKYGIEEVIREIPAELHLFDVIYINGREMFDSTLEERSAELRKIVTPIHGKIRFAEELRTNDLIKADAFYKKALSEGQEGLIVKNLDAKYMPGRRVAGGWLKVKPTMENLDLVIMGGLWGSGKRAGYIGSLILGCRDPDTGKFLECGMLGSGLLEKESEGTEKITLDNLTKMLKPLITNTRGSAVIIRPKIVIEVAYEEIQKSPTYTSGYALRFPRFIRLRPDKGPQEADDKDRVEALYAMQKGKAPKEK
ncbi:MAG: ATP-dependent DNA ligase [Candidatus Aenigmatarchaeota archaeon]